MPAKNLVIVESPAKAKTIEKYLGKDYTVMSCFGHVSDLPKNELGIDVDNNFDPKYSVSPDKKKVVSDLKKVSDSSEMVWLASDEDREGEAIAWHLVEALKLEKEKIKRIVFHEITKKAIENAVKNPRDLNLSLVNAQQARRVLDRIVGYQLSPVLWKKIKGGLSAGRVQSVAVRVIVERERKIKTFNTESSFKTTAKFKKEKSAFNAVCENTCGSKEEALELLENCKNSEFEIQSVTKKPLKRSPVAPFTTSTLQQDAARKHGYSVSKTMMLAQRLYEAGHITYMRTDSVNLSDEILNNSKNRIISQYGDEYYHKRTYKTKSKGAQEAHEAIRPTNIDAETLDINKDQDRLYSLIWKRTMASQMTDAQIEKTHVKIENEKKVRFNAVGEVIKFDGFLKVYSASEDEEELDETAEGFLPEMKEGEMIDCEKIISKQRFSRPPYRYTEASLVRKLEELGIGRPSTYAPTISTIQKREYIAKGDNEGQEREFIQLNLDNNEIKEQLLNEKFNSNKGKLVPTDIGYVVNDFLIQHFEGVLDYGFTAKVEEEFDEIASGNGDWKSMIKDFYSGFHKTVESVEQNAEREKGERHIGEDPKTKKKVIARIGRYGPMVQIGEVTDEEKPKFAKLTKGLEISEITLEQALKLFEYPKILGKHNESEISVGVGRFGPYVKYDKKFASIPKETGISEVDLKMAIKIIQEKEEKQSKAVIHQFPEEGDNAEIQVLNGRYGAYIKYQKKNYRIPKGTDAEKLSREECQEIIDKSKK